MAQPTPNPQPNAASVLAIGGAGLLALAAAHRLRQQVLARRAREAFRTLWRFVDPRNPQASWARVSPTALAYMTAAQREAARGGDEYVTAALAHQGVEADPAGALVTSALSGVAADGRDLPGLLSYPAFEVSAFVDQGMDENQALAIGQRHLDRIVQTEVADAARVATGVAVASDRKVTGYIRMLTPPSCSRCVILAGRFYKWNAGFQRHPLCDCVMVPSVEDVAGDVRTDPKAYFDSLSEKEQNATFTKAGAQAVRDGADVFQVVNARRGAIGLTPAGARLTAEEAKTLRGGKQRGRLQRVDVFGHQLYVTTEGVTTRGQAGRALGARDTGVKAKGQRYRQARAPRLMPESIYEIAGDDREEALRLLRVHGYITR